jgi:hypothetical protein
MNEKPLGIFYLDYAEVSFPKSRRKMIIDYTRSGFLQQMIEKNIPDNYFCWLSECRTSGYLVEGNTETVRAWIDKHMPEKFGEPWTI